MRDEESGESLDSRDFCRWHSRGSYGTDLSSAKIVPPIALRIVWSDVLWKVPVTLADHRSSRSCCCRPRAELLRRQRRGGCPTVGTDHPITRILNHIPPGHSRIATGLLRAGVPQVGGDIQRLGRRGFGEAVQDRAARQEPGLRPQHHCRHFAGDRPQDVQGDRDVSNRPRTAARSAELGHEDTVGQ